MASSSVVLPEPLVPMMPVRPVSNVTTVSACWRKFWSWRRWSLTARRSLGDSDAAHWRGGLDRVRLAQVVEAKSDEAVAVDVARHDASLQVIAPRICQRRSAAGATARDGA